MFVLAFPGESRAQQGSYRVRYVAATNDSIGLDTLMVLPASIKVTLDGNPVSTYFYNPSSGKFIWKGEPTGMLKIGYQVLLFDFRKTYSHKDPKLIQPQVVGNPFAYTPSRGHPIGKNYDGVNFMGNISRGIGFGNSQDLVVNSNLNLQLSGRLNNDIDVVAAISDQDNPIQPEGNTQQLQDFDRVYIRLSKNTTSLTAGDFLMERPAGSYFMNYYKKSRGLQFSHGDSLGEGVITVSGEAAISRGRFARNVLIAVEGNQGPYRLTGVNGEIFIIVIAGTEAVYLDGQKLARGEQNDYVINYNTGEVTFMPRRIITQYSRIIVEFQYSDRNYSRTVFRTGAEYNTAKLALRANYFTEQDLKNQPFQQDLNDSARSILAQVGDSLQDAVVSSARQAVFDPLKINYRLADTLGYQAFVYTDNAQSDTVFYQVSFSFVGEGNGDYIIAQSSANGRVYSWVDPTGGRRGAYAPVTPIIAPNRQQMLSLGADLKLGRTTVATAEVAFTNKNNNTFSSRDKADDDGIGIRLGVTDQRRIGSDSLKAWTLSSSANFEHISRTFRYIERYRPVEFDRTWARQLNNPASSTPAADENIGTLTLGLRQGSTQQFSYGFGIYDKSDGFTGIRNTGGALMRVFGFILAADGELLNTVLPQQPDIDQLNHFYRYRAELARPLNWFTLGASYSTENNQYRRSDSSLLLGGSYSFRQFTTYVQSADTSNLKYRIESSRRYDELPLADRFTGSTRADNIGGTVEHTSKRGNRLLVNLTYRELQPLDTQVIKTEKDKSLLARFEYDLYLFRRSIILNNFYQVGSGQEQRREFSYVEVPAGNGIYAWNDFNSDGIQQLNEFQVAVFKDQARYIRVFVPVPGFVRSRFNQINQTLTINPPAAWRNAKGLKHALSKFNVISNFTSDRRSLDDNLLRSISPYDISTDDSLLLSMNSGMRHTLFFNRSGPVFGFDVSYIDNRSRVLLTTGKDTRLRRETGFNIRYNLSAAWGLSLQTSTGNRTFTSQYFTENNYDYVFYRTEPRITWQYKTSLRLSLIGVFSDSKNDPGLGGERAIDKELATEVRFNMLTKGSFSARGGIAIIDFNGAPNTPLAYEMLQGLQKGNNALWSLSYQQRITGNIQLTMQYDGRKTETARTVHIGRVEARYIF